MTKINVGIFVVVALAIRPFVGSRNMPLLLPILANVGGMVLPFVLMTQTFSQTWMATYEFLIGISVLFLCVVMNSRSPLDTGFRIVPFVAGAASTVVALAVWPWLTGPHSTIWPLFLVTVTGVALAALLREPRVGGRPIRETHWAVALGLIDPAEDLCVLVVEPAEEGRDRSGVVSQSMGTVRNDPQHRTRPRRVGQAARIVNGDDIVGTAVHEEPRPG